ncbi:hypothetical protein B0H13DRAFT_1905573 [Mycena leptocephala]|nr:hypothetical protein B0H13DRAFT_1905573 [Mycena leptocephala]
MRKCTFLIRDFGTAKGCKAILSKFSQTQKAPAETINETAEDTAILGDLLQEEDIKDEDTEFDVTDNDEIDPALEQSGQAVVDEVNEDIDLDDRLPALTSRQHNLGRYSILKLRTLAKKIVHSPTIKADLATACVRSQISPRLMVRNVSTRWNSTAELLKRGLELREALNF